MQIFKFANSVIPSIIFVRSVSIILFLRLQSQLSFEQKITFEKMWKCYSSNLHAHISLFTSTFHNIGLHQFANFDWETRWYDIDFASSLSYWDRFHIIWLLHFQLSIFHLNLSTDINLQCLRFWFHPIWVAIQPHFIDPKVWNGHSEPNLKISLNERY